MSLTHASFTVMASPQVQFDVQLNPESLQYDLTNAFQTDEDGGATQQVEETTAKLSMDLVWDSTDDGSDVRNKTRKLMAMMRPGDGDAPPRVRFRWGAFSFQGFLESFKEVLDFFSENGVPLRATTSLVFTEQGVDWERALQETSLTASGIDGAFEVPTLGRPVNQSTDDGSGSGGGTGSGGGGGDGASTDTGRGVAEDNGIENLRNPETDTLVVASGGASLEAGVSAGAVFSAGGGFGVGGTAGFAAGVGLGGQAALGASAGAAAGFGLSAGVSASAGVGFGASAGIGVGVGASAGIGVGVGASAGVGFGASAGVGFGASAGVGFGASASAGAVAGVGASAGLSVGASAGASFGASAGAGASAGFEASASVHAGASASWSGGAGYEASASWSASAGYSTGSAGSWAWSDASASITRSYSGASQGYSTAQWFEAPRGSSASRDLERALAQRFSGLRVQAPRRYPRPDPSRLLRLAVAQDGAPATPTRFLPGGRAIFGDPGNHAHTNRPLVLSAAVRIEEDRS